MGFEGVPMFHASSSRGSVAAQETQVCWEKRSVPMEMEPVRVWWEGRERGAAGEGAERGAPPASPSLLASSQAIVGVWCIFSIGINLSPNRGDAYAPIW